MLSDPTLFDYFERPTVTMFTYLEHDVAFKPERGEYPPHDDAWGNLQLCDYGYKLQQISRASHPGYWVSHENGWMYEYESAVAGG